MNRIFSVGALVLSFVLPAAAFAASVGLSPASVSVKPGEVFTVTVLANPAGAHVYTVRANISFNPSLVSVTNFAFAPKWIQLTQPGYDAIDNTNGSLIKTAGYPGGITNPTVLGTATFTAKKAGTAAITATNQSLLLDANGKNALSGTQGLVSVVVTVPPTPTPAPKPKQTAATTQTASVVRAVAFGATATASASASTTAASTSVATAPAATSAPATAATSSSTSGGSSSLPIVIVVIVIALLLALWWMNSKRTPKTPSA
ncbi:MAG TPA: cohesin domain-containing protein [Candidatus Paceibacterota bacterium]|nr:cohesin domain-containing protein [Candidatus Paceibacterota bacterium]